LRGGVEIEQRVGLVFQRDRAGALLEHREQHLILLLPLALIAQALGDVHAAEHREPPAVLVLGDRLGPAHDALVSGMVADQTFTLGTGATGELPLQIFARALMLGCGHQQLDVAATDERFASKAGESLQTRARAHDARIGIHGECDRGQALEYACRRDLRRWFVRVLRGIFRWATRARKRF